MMMMSLQKKLDDGVVQTFNPSYEAIVGRYLYNKIDHVVIGSTNHVFPLLDLYGEAGMQPWIVSAHLEPTKIPHQEFYYFYSRLKSLSPKGRGKRCLRRVGSGTWSETEISKPVNFHGVPFGRVKKFRYENTKSEHHGAWMMEEFSINHCDVPSSDLVLCRMKRNQKRGCGRKRKAVENVANKAKMLRCSVEEEQHLTCSVDDFPLSQIVVDHQRRNEGGHHQLDLCNNVDVGDDVIVSQSEAAGFEKDGMTWSFDNAKMMATCSVESKQHETSLFENHIAAGGDVQVVQPIIGSQSRENEEGGTGYNASTSQAVPLSSFASDQMTSTPASLSQQQHYMFSLPAIDDQVASGFAWDNSIISTDASLCYQIDDFGFLFEN